MKWLAGITENLGTKILALVFATALYFHVITERPVEQVLSFPVQLQGLPDSIALAMPAPDAVTALVRGTGKQIIRMRVVPPTVSLNLAGVGPGRYQRSLTNADFQAVSDEGLDVVRPVQPATLDLKLEARATRRVPVVVVVQGEPQRGYVITGPPQAHPAEVRLSGPQSWVREQETLYTEPLSMAGKKGAQEIVHPLAELPPWAAATPGSVLVTVAIDPEATGEERLTPRLAHARSGFRVRLEPSTVRVRWSAPRPGGAAPEHDLIAEIDVAERGRGRYVLPVRIRGAGAEWVREVSPESVSVVIQ